MSSPKIAKWSPNGLQEKKDISIGKKASFNKYYNYCTFAHRLLSKRKLLKQEVHLLRQNLSGEGKGCSCHRNKAGYLLQGWHFLRKDHVPWKELHGKEGPVSAILEEKAEIFAALGKELSRMEQKKATFENVRPLLRLETTLQVPTEFAFSTDRWVKNCCFLFNVLRIASGRTLHTSCRSLFRRMSLTARKSGEGMMQTSTSDIVSSICYESKKPILPPDQKSYLSLEELKGKKENDKTRTHTKQQF